MKPKAKTLSALLFLSVLGCATATIEPGEAEESGDGDGDGDFVTSTGGVTIGTSTGGVTIGSGGSPMASGGSPSGGSSGDGDGDVVGDGDGDVVGAGGGNVVGAGGSDVVGDGDGDGDGAGGGDGDGTGGAAVGNCPAADCSDGAMATPITGATCLTVTIGQYGGWQISSDDGCAIVIDGAPGTNAAMLNDNMPHEIEVSGCMYNYATLGCWGGT